MKKVSIVLILLFVAGTAGAQNLLLNPGFEYSPYDTNWTVWGNMRDACDFPAPPSPYPDGINLACTQTGNGTTDGGIYQTVTGLQAGSTCNVEAWLWASAGKYTNCADLVVRNNSCSVTAYWNDGGDGGTAWTAVPGSAVQFGQESGTWSASTCGGNGSAAWVQYTTTTGAIASGACTMLVHFQSSVDWDSFGGQDADATVLTGTLPVLDWQLF